ncbi:hypothetical protein TWF694_010255 [Orbilia ellipsospora]|uniref:SET domain-containing protein n=1 Tax=Orbilia ellipsospora TaxID=2528407 RepID=A0AAV9X9N5_9PEZI
MSQTSQSSQVVRKRGRPPSNNPNRNFKKMSLDAQAKSKPVTQISENILAWSNSLRAPSQSSSSTYETRQGTRQINSTRSSRPRPTGNVYRDHICLICWMPFCTSHSLRAPEKRQTVETIKWVLKREDISESHLADKRPSFQPCSHEGSCDPGNPDCSCSDESVHCEKGCGCLSTCPRRWKGCQCKNGKSCSGERCPCINYNRECDPDLCSGCGAEEQLDPLNRRGQSSNLKLESDGLVVLTREEVRETGCQNVFLQIGEPPMTKVGKTTMPFEGYGLFAMERIVKGGFVGEYMGEIISDEEADYRGSEYDRGGMSFLFAINTTHALDGTKFANKTRYMNHSGMEPNCEAKVLFVNGIHRIAFRALEDIEVGEELLFDYGDKFFGFDPVERDGAQERKKNKIYLSRLKEQRRGIGFDEVEDEEMEEENEQNSHVEGDKEPDDDKQDDSEHDGDDGREDKDENRMDEEPDRTTEKTAVEVNSITLMGPPPPPPSLPPPPPPPPPSQSLSLSLPPLKEVTKEVLPSSVPTSPVSPSLVVRKAIKTMRKIPPKERKSLPAVAAPFISSDDEAEAQILREGHFFPPS